MNNIYSGTKTTTVKYATFNEIIHTELSNYCFCIFVFLCSCFSIQEYSICILRKMERKQITTLLISTIILVCHISAYYLPQSNAVMSACCLPYYSHANTLPQGGAYMSVMPNLSSEL